ncbi:endonuclease/exonuclease/phosphatase family protein [Bifidobacterium sp. MA2]|uniref:Endonuclease/exonuclease/phosphatase family protein n=1 Tax=Bifidobacterium santillanense TaxID=2809028 RepID=A0ABS5UPL3_9BIFI|nr:endonuclease/exonuclease/phosphatase family protein [Bifidobacterium santillanense]MBT1172817.1 endonuclease/exonuclease/phosphatase family protein [Bifidobacterium santillanense]
MANGNGRDGGAGGGRRGHRMMGAVSTLLAMLAVVGTAARALPSDLQDTPYVPILVSATPWFILVAALSLVLAFASKRVVTVVVALGLLAVNVWWQYPFFSTREKLPGRALSAVAQPSPILDDAYARVMTFNVYKGRADARAIVDTVRDQHVEVLALQETTEAFVARLDEAGIGDYLPYSHVSSSDGVYGNGLWSATPLGDPADDDVNSSASFMPGGTVAFAGGARSIRFVSVHTTAPVPGYWGQWRRALDELALMRDDASTVYVFMGDFNATYDHAPFRGFLGDRFSDAARMAGRGFTFTWPADRIVPPAFAGIDHVVVDRGIVAGEMKVKRIAGSDHEALLATIAVE